MSMSELPKIKIVELLPEDFREIVEIMDRSGLVPGFYEVTDSQLRIGNVIFQCDPILAGDPPSP
jgi:hypothetical protein